MDTKEETPIRNRYYNATITVCANGFVVNIGCQTVVAETPEKLLQLITEYLNDPKKAERKLFAESISMNQPQTAPTPVGNGLRTVTESAAERII